MLISIIIPVFNEKDNIHPLLDVLLPIAENYAHEIIFVNDGSRDGTDKIIRNIASQNKQIKLISFNRNFGHQIALMAGYSFAKGDAVISMDADLQDPPSAIPEMIEKWQNGAKIVYAKRKRRDVDSVFKKKTAAFFYQCINMLSDIKIPENVGDFRLLDRDAVDYLKKLPEHSPFLRGLVAWGGYKEDYVYFDREERHSGKTHYSISKMINFALDGITSFSVKPLRLATYMGFSAGSFGFLGIMYAIIGKFFLPIPWVTGWTGIFVGIMFIGGVQLITIGIIGEYISKIYLEILKRPHYLLKEKINID